MIKKLLGFIFLLWQKTNNNNSKALILFAVVACFFAECIANPKAAINTFMIHVIDTIFGFLPSTPPAFTASGLLLSFAAANPAVGMGLISEILSIVFPMFAIYLSVKLYKFLPFT